MGRCAVACARCSLRRPSVVPASQQPLVTLSARCKLPISLPQLMGLMQAAQQGGALPGSLPGALQTAQTMGVPTAGVPGLPSPASAAAQGGGPLPGPSAATTR